MLKFTSMNLAILCQIGKLNFMNIFILYAYWVLWGWGTLYKQRKITLGKTLLHWPSFIDFSEYAKNISV